MILILTLMLINPDSLLQEYEARQEMSKKHYWEKKKKISDFTLQGVGRESFEDAEFLLQYNILTFLVLAHEVLFSLTLRSIGCN